MPILAKEIKGVSAATILALALGLSCMASAENKKPAAPAPKPASPARTGGSSSGAPRGPSMGGAPHGPTTGGPSANRPSGPSANGGGFHTTTTTTTTMRTTTTVGGRPGGGPGGTSTAGGTHTMIRSGPAPRGSNEHLTGGGSAIRTRPNGRVSDVHDARRGIDVHHGLAGGEESRWSVPITAAFLPTGPQRFCGAPLCLSWTRLRAAHLLLQWPCV